MTSTGTERKEHDHEPASRHRHWRRSCLARAPARPPGRVAWPTDRLDEVIAFYVNGLGLTRLGDFEGHAGYDGVIVGPPGTPYHLEVTHHVDGSPGDVPTAENLLVLSLSSRTAASYALLLLALGGAVAACWFIGRGQEGAAFAATAVTLGSTIAALFAALYPDVLVSSTSSANNLTIAGTVSQVYALQVMTIAAGVFFPLVLLYQG